jgi:D-arabinose 1-dehydrogenase-like Zn-dependent alcohol dehydrogenase
LQILDFAESILQSIVTGIPGLALSVVLMSVPGRFFDATRDHSVPSNSRHSTIGHQTVTESDGSLTTLGYAAERKAPIDVTNLIWKRASIKSFSLFAQPQAPWAEAWDAIVPLLQSGAIKPIVAKTLRLAEAADALRCLVEGRPFGRVVLTI